MSLIEQAAKRLEQLRNAGVDVAGEAMVATRDTAQSAIVDAPAALPEAARHGRLEKAPPKRPPVTSRLVEIDLVRLASAGFITPEGAATRVAHEFRLIKRPLLDNVQGRSAAPVAKANMIMVTSAWPGEGKTFTSINLAMSLALELDNTVLLVDADVTRPNVMASLGLADTKGLMDVLLESKLDLSDVLLRTNVEKLSLLPAGSGNTRATEVLASEAMVALVDDLAGRYPERIVIFDAPPLLATTESRVLAKHMGQVVVVVEADKTTHRSVTDAFEAIKDCPVVATVLNKASSSEPGGYGYGGYGYGYGYGYGKRSGSGRSGDGRAAGGAQVGKDDPEV